MSYTFLKEKGMYLFLYKLSFFSTVEKIAIHIYARWHYGAYAHLLYILVENCETLLVAEPRPGAMSKVPWACPNSSKSQPRRLKTSVKGRRAGNSAKESSSLNGAPWPGQPLSLRSDPSWRVGSLLAIRFKAMFPGCSL